MSEITGIIDTLEARIEKLLNKIAFLESRNAALRQEIVSRETTVGNQGQEIGQLKSANETLRAANALLGSEENKRDTKLKINSLIREIDYCIAQLAD